MDQRQAPALQRRVCLATRRASMHRFERLYTPVLMALAVALAVAMTGFICLTRHLIA